MRPAGPLVAALLVATCSGGGDPAEYDAATNVAAADASAPEGAATGNMAVPRGDVSGLNTRITDMGLVIDLPSDALLEYDNAELTPAAENELRKAAELIRASPPGSIQVIERHG